MSGLPNLLTAARLLAAPYIFYLLWTGRFRAALAWFALAGITDVLDGYFARRYQAGSRLGALLDPVADKVLLDGAFLILGLKSIIPFSLTIFVLGRDLMILVFAMVALARKTRRDFPPSVWGKASTAAQIGYVLFAVGHEGGLAPFAIVAILGWITFGLTVWSGIDYARRVS
ncbi:MAG TPA: CDP-alcohol phosphatidyltransferase family protein [Bryobacteraceae bacterium]